MVMPIPPQEVAAPAGALNPVDQAREVIRALSARALKELSERMVVAGRQFQGRELAPNVQRITLAALGVFEPRPAPGGLAAIGHWTARLLSRVRDLLSEQSSLQDLTPDQLTLLNSLSVDEVASLILKEQTRQTFLSEVEEWKQASSGGVDYDDLERTDLADRLLLLADHPSFPDNVLDLRICGYSFRELPGALRHLRNLHTLILGDLTGLRSLPDSMDALVSLSSLCIYNCPCLDELPPSLGRCPALEELYVRGAPWLNYPASLSQAPSLSLVDFGGPLSAVPDFVELLPRRAQVLLPPSAPGAEALHARSLQPGYEGPSIEINEFAADDVAHQEQGDLAHATPFVLSRQSLDTHPRRVLTDLARTLRRGPQRLKVEYEGEPGSDYGGLSSDLWTNLGQKLFAKEGPSDDFLPATAESTDEKEIGEGWRPVMERERDRQSFRDLGLMLGWGATHRLAFPRVFDPGVPAALLATLQDRPPFEVVARYLRDPYLQLLLENPREWTPKQQQDIFALADTLLEEDWAALEAPADKIAFLERSGVEQMKAGLVADKQPILLFLSALLQGMHESDPQLIADLKNLTLPALETRLFGRLNRRAIAQAVSCQLSAGISPADAQALTRWTREWILNASDKQLRNFLFEITGQEGLLEGAKIALRPVREGPINCHSCFNWMDVPDINRTTEAIWKASLDELTTHRSERFNTM